jgi:PAS domain S-box-containing protein
MQPYSIAPIVMATISICSALPELRLWFQKKGRPDSLAFFFTCLGVACYCAACAGYYSVDRPSLSLPWSRFLSISFCAMGMGFIWFIGEFTGLVPRTTLRILVGFYALGALIQALGAFLPDSGFADLTWVASKPAVAHIGLPHLLPLTLFEVETGPISDIFQMSGFVALAIIVRPIVAYYGDGHRRDAKALSFAVGIIALSYTVDFLIDRGLIQGLYTLEYSWMGFILIMGSRRWRQLREGEEAKRAFAESELSFKAIVDKSFDLIAVCDASGRALFLSPSFGRALDYSVPDLIGRRLYELVHPEDRKLLLVGRSSPGDSLGRSLVCFRVRKADGVWMDFEGVISPFGLASSMGGILVTGRDITERKKAEEAIVSSLKEKDELLKEAHHRVKNNFQIILSLLSFQTGKDRDTPVGLAIGESRSQVAAMAAVHENLYREPDLTRIDIRACARRITENLLATFGKEGRIAVELGPGTLALGLDVALPIALIVNELVSDSALYGFPGLEAPDGAAIRIEFARRGEGRASLCISDNWNGAIACAEGDPLYWSLAIVRNLALPLKGSVAVDKRPGFGVLVEFATEAGPFAE